MSLAEFDVTHERETAVSRNLQLAWHYVRQLDPRLRCQMTVGLLVGCEHGRVQPGYLTLAMADPAVVGRAVTLLAAVRHRMNDGGEWSTHG